MTLEMQRAKRSTALFMLRLMRSPSVPAMVLLAMALPFMSILALALIVLSLSYKLASEGWSILSRTEWLRGLPFLKRWASR